jgi:HEAT repeat protein
MNQQVDPIVLRLVKQLDDPDPRHRQNALGSLRLNGLKAVDAIPEIARLLNDNDPEVRMEAQRAIDRLCRSVA